MSLCIFHFILHAIIVRMWLMHSLIEGKSKREDPNKLYLFFLRRSAGSFVRSYRAALDKCNAFDVNANDYTQRKNDDEPNCGKKKEKENVCDAISVMRQRQTTTTTAADRESFVECLAHAQKIFHHISHRFNSLFVI